MKNFERIARRAERKMERKMAGNNSLPKRPKINLLGFSDTNTVAHRFSYKLDGEVTVYINGKKVDIASYGLKVGDVVSVSDKSKATEKFKGFAENPKALPSWIEGNAENFSAKIVSEPSRSEIDVPINETLIVELYSK